MFPIAHLLLNFTLLLSLVISPAREPISTTHEAGEGLPFTTIKIAQGGVGFPWQAPGLYMVWEKSELSKITPWVGSDTWSELNEVNFDRDYVVAVFHGHRGHADSLVRIVQYEIRDNTVVLTAEFWRLSDDFTVPTIETSPYHIIKAKKDSRLSASSNVEMHSELITYHIYHEDAGIEWPITASLPAGTE